MSQVVIMLPKNKLVGQCQLILQPNERAYHYELTVMQQEQATEKKSAHDVSAVFRIEVSSESFIAAAGSGWYGFGLNYGIECERTETYWKYVGVRYQIGLGSPANSSANL